MGLNRLQSITMLEAAPLPETFASMAQIVGQGLEYELPL
jgi:hypothetical protein